MIDNGLCNRHISSRTARSKSLMERFGDHFFGVGAGGEAARTYPKRQNARVGDARARDVDVALIKLEKNNRAPASVL